jgi:hypothetical protein
MDLLGDFIRPSHLLNLFFNPVRPEIDNEFFRGNQIENNWGLS